ELDDHLPEQLQEALRLFGRTDVRRRDDLDERRPRPVEIDERAFGPVDPALGAADVHRLRRILLEMRADDPDLAVAVQYGHDDAPVHAQRFVVLGDLVALRVVRVEVVLAVEDRARGDLAAEREPEQDRPLDGLAVRHGQRARHRKADRARLRVRRLEVRDRTAAEQLRPRLQVDVDLEPDDRFPGAHLYRSGT